MLTKSEIIYNIHFSNEYAESAATLYLGILNIAVMFIMVTVGFISKSESFLKFVFKYLKWCSWLLVYFTTYN